MEYKVIVNDKEVGSFTDKRQAEDYAKSVGGRIESKPMTQHTKPSMEKLTQ